MTLPPSFKRVPFWRCMAFNLCLALWTTVTGLLWLPGSIFSQRIAQSIAWPWTSGAVWLAKHICGIEYSIRGDRNIRFTRVIIASKHQSALEIIVLLNMFPNAAFIIKRELIFIPIFGQYLWRMGMVPLNRKRKAALFETMLAKSRRILHAERPLIVFPEGTRIPAGTRSRYLPGVALLYDDIKLPVVPVAVNCGVYWPKNRWEKYAGKAVIEFLPRIEPGLKLREFLRTLEERIESASATLYEEALTSSPTSQK